MKEKLSRLEAADEADDVLSRRQVAEIVVNLTCITKQLTDQHVVMLAAIGALIGANYRTAESREEVKAIVRNGLRRRGALTDERDSFLERIFSPRAEKFSVVQGGAQE